MWKDVEQTAHINGHPNPQVFDGSCKVLLSAMVTACKASGYRKYIVGKGLLWSMFGFALVLFLWRQSHPIMYESQTGNPRGLSCYPLLQSSVWSCHLYLVVYSVIDSLCFHTKLALSFVVFVCFDPAFCRQLQS